MKISSLKMNVTGSSVYPNGINLSSKTILTGGEIKDCKFTNTKNLSGLDLSKMTIANVQVKTIPVFN